MSFVTRKTLAALGLGLTGLGLSFIGCSSDDTNTPNPPPQDGGKDTGTSTGPKQSGRVLTLGATEGVSGATVSLGSASGTTTTETPKGNYSVAVTKDAPFFMRVSAPTYTTLLEQEWSLSADQDRGPTSLPLSTTTRLLAGNLPGASGTKGVLAVGIEKQGGCTNDGDATIRVDTGAGGGDAGSDAGDSGASDAGSTDAGPVAPQNVVVYFESPTSANPSRTSTKAGQTRPSALIYNITPGDNVKLIVEHPTCKAVTEFPYTDPATPGIKYTGRIKVEPLGNPDPGPATTSFTRIFLIPK